MLVNNRESDCSPKTWIRLDTVDAFNSNFVNSTHTIGCRCKKTLCLKKYCECYATGVFCGKNCCCSNCANAIGSKGNVSKPAILSTISVATAPNTVCMTGVEGSFMFQGRLVEKEESPSEGKKAEQKSRTIRHKMTQSTRRMKEVGDDDTRHAKKGDDKKGIEDGDDKENVDQDGMTGNQDNINDSSFSQSGSLGQEYMTEKEENHYRWYYGEEE